MYTLKIKDIIKYKIQNFNYKQWNLLGKNERKYSNLFLNEISVKEELEIHFHKHSTSILIQVKIMNDIK